MYINSYIFVLLFFYTHLYAKTMKGAKMPVLPITSRHSINLSLTDLRTLLDDKRHEEDRVPTVTEDKYQEKVLVGNWFERRAKHVPYIDKLLTTYRQDYKKYCKDLYKKDGIEFWDNKIGKEGLPRSLLMDHHGTMYIGNMTTTNDLCYRVLPAVSHKRKLRKYNMRKDKWLPEEDLTKNHGNLTQFGMKDALKAWWESDTKEAMEYCRWRTTYQDEFKNPEVSPIKT